MLRYLRVSGDTKDESTIAYFVNKAVVISSAVVNGISAPWQRTPAVLSDRIVMNIPALTSDVYFETIIAVSNNQPKLETVSEYTTKGVAISVFNENGVKICDNGVAPPSAPASGTTNAPGEMTSVPIDGIGEMTSVPGEEPGEMASETTDEPSVMI